MRLVPQRANVGSTLAERGKTPSWQNVFCQSRIIARYALQNQHQKKCESMNFKEFVISQFAGNVRYFRAMFNEQCFSKRAHMFYVCRSVRIPVQAENRSTGRHEILQAICLYAHTTASANVNAFRQFL